MAGPLEVAGDVASAGSALAGLLLVFMGSIATSFDGYQKQEQRAVLKRFQRRVWFAFIGFSLAILATLLALLAKWHGDATMAAWAICILIVSMGWVVTAAIRAAMDVK